MEPTLREHRLVVFSRVCNYTVGDIVLAFMDGREVVKRISEYRDGQVFLVGDNESQSTDSRTHGWLIDRQVHGKLVYPRAKKLQ